MNSLHEHVDEYLRLRRSLGFKLRWTDQLLAHFADFCEEAGSDTVTVDLALAWACQPQGCQPSWWATRLKAVRPFARHLNAIDSRHQVPPPDLLPWGLKRAEPFIYSSAEVAQLMSAASRLGHPLVAATYSTYLGLLSVTGMRASEAINLDRADVLWSESLLVIRDSKFGRSREVVLHASALDALHEYDRQRQRHCSRPQTTAFFTSSRGTRLIYADVQRTFHKLTKRVGLAPCSERCRPRLHDFRHTFAVDTLLGWYRAGLDVDVRMHLLTTYLGHIEPASTYWYLSATPELMAIVAERLERQLGELP